MVILFLLYILVVFSKDVHFDLKSTWIRPSLSQEASEFFSETDYLSFWSIFDQCERIDFSSQKTEFESLKKFLKPSEQSLFEYSLSISYHSPLISTFQRLGETVQKENNIKVENFVVCEQSKEVFTSPKTLQAYLNAEKKPFGVKDERFLIFPFDHIYKDVERIDAGKPVCILYGKYDGENVASLLEFHKILAADASSNKVNYLFRHFSDMKIPRKDHWTNKEYQDLFSLQGYGIELQIKNLEYRTMDPKARPKAQAPSEFAGIKFDELIKMYPEEDFKLNMFRQQLIEETKEVDIGNIKVWELQELGMQTAQRIIESNDQLESLKDVSQNFPTQFVDIIRNTKLNQNIVDELKHNAPILEKYYGITEESKQRTFMFLNGIELDLERMSIFTIYDLLKSEMEFENSLNEMNLLDSEISQILQVSATSGSSQGSEDIYERKRFDFIPHDIISWMNDIEKNNRYRMFPKPVDTVLQPPFNGRKQFARRNLFNLVFVIDPTTLTGIQNLKIMKEILSYGAPFHVGIVFHDFSTKKDGETIKVDVGISGNQKKIESEEFDTTSVYARLTAIFEFLKEEHSVSKAVDFLIYFLDNLNGRKSVKLDEESIIREFNTHYGDEDEDINEIWNDQEFFETNKKMQKVLQTTEIPSFQFLMFNGKIISLESRTVNLILQLHFLQEYEAVQKLVISETIEDEDEDMFSSVLTGLNALTSFNSIIFSDEKYISIEEKELEALEPKYLSFDDEEIKKFSHLVFLDFEDPKSLQTIKNGIFHSFHQDSRSRIAFINTNTEVTDQSFKIYEVIDHIYHNSQSFDNDDIVTIFRNFESGQFSSGSKIEENEVKANLLSQSTNSQKISHLKNFVVMNGRILDLQEKVFGKIDFEVLEQFSAEIINKIYEILTENRELTGKENVEVLNSLVFKVSSFLFHSNSESKTSSLKRVNEENIFPSELKQKFTKISVNKDSKGPKIRGIIDPISKDAQKISDILLVFGKFFHFEVEFLLFPNLQVSGIPMKSFYRFVVDPNLQFNEDSGKLMDSGLTNLAKFDDLPSEYILTLYTDEPETWLLESTHSIYDIDNINLDLIDEKMKIRFQLEKILITGNSVDSTFSQNGKLTPRGLQFDIVPVGMDKDEQEPKNGKKKKKNDSNKNKDDAIVHYKDLNEDKQDTLVMANLGYFQLKANPNVFNFKIGKGRHSKIYEFNKISISSFFFRNSNTKKSIKGKQSVPIYVTHFDGPFLHVDVKKKKGKENTELLKKTRKKPWSVFGKKKKETINIFSVATGHLYERLLKIMMRSVMRTTKKSNVKFWILKNYLSPQFKEFLPYMAQKYGFEYGYVTYKWPTWLNKQTNKIRIIWANKILFLDVLFPQDVKKIIYVDSDQATRADLTDLWNLDMQGKALAYTPMCSDKPEMDGYAFWTKGYWKNHLRGKPYHISALYVVDIEELRRKYYGDQYRSIYDNLSKDPNSLSNLDQDLPNFAQHMIPIRSLPMEWLWCETWCSKDSKIKAKTIDLCNNPQTKEHKVSQAKRIINKNADWDFNWVDLDEEVTTFTESINKKWENE